MTSRDEGRDRPPQVGAGDSEIEEALRELERAADRLRIPAIGARVDRRYRVEEHIGHGGFGWVFGVRHIHLQQRFAMKILNPRIAQDPDWVVRFREEARATSLIGHENIVFVTDFGECEEYGYYLVMEHLDGTPLDRLLAEEEGPQPIERVMRFAVAAGSALSAVHELGIVHCDLKPSNVMMLERPGRHETWKLLDFGTSTIVLSAAESSAVYGTPSYMPPEQAVGLDLDPRVDQFALASIIYEMLVGRTPYTTHSWVQATAAHRKRQKIAPPSECNDECPPGLDSVLLRALQLRRENRWSTIDAFIDALRATVEVSWVPAADPFDVRAGDAQFERSMTAPAVSMAELGSGDSMVVDIEEDPQTPHVTPTVRVNFKTASRLRREYRRNMIAGGLFVPTSRTLPLHTRVDIDLRYEPLDRGIVLEASVVASESAAPEGGTRGYGVAFSEAQRRLLQRFLRSLDIGIGVAQNDVLHPVQTLDDDNDDLSAGEAFLLSRLTQSCPVGRIRAMCSGLPFEFDDVMSSLIEKGYLELERNASAQSSVFAAESTVRDLEPIGAHDAAESTLRSGPTVRFSAREVRQILEFVDFFCDRQNYLAAMDVLRRAIDLCPTTAIFHHRLAHLLVEFSDDVPAAVASQREAVALDPSNTEYQATLERLETSP